MKSADLHFVPLFRAKPHVFVSRDNPLAHLERVTLADLALAAAANSHGTLAFSLSSNITFLRSSGPGDVLYAEARERYIGRTTGYYQIDVTNQEGKLIATFESSVFRKGDNITFSLPQTSSDSGCPGHS